MTLITPGSAGNQESDLDRIIERHKSNFDPGFHLKKLEKSDIPGLVGIDEEINDTIAWDAEEFAEEFQIETNYGVIVYKDGHAIGYLMGHDDRDLPTESMMKITPGVKGAYLSGNGVIPEFQGNHIFTRMFACFEELAKAQGYQYIRLHTRTAENPETDGVYLVFQKLGFQIIRTHPNYYEDDERDDDAYEMMKTL